MYTTKITLDNSAYGDLSLAIRPTELTADNGAFYTRKEGYMASQEGIRKIYTCLCQEQMARPSV
jgi:hypothetical protein